MTPFKTDAVPVPDVHRKTLENRLRNAASEEERQEIQKELKELFEVMCERCYDATGDKYW